MKETFICVVNDCGEIILEGKAASEPVELSDYFSKLNLKLEMIGFEAGRTSSWLHQGLQTAGWPVVCMEARHLNGVLKTQNVKTDRNDARGIAQAVRTGWYRTVHIKSQESQELRAVLTYRRSIVQTKVNLSNQLRGLLCSFGIKAGKTTESEYATRVRALISDLASPLLINLTERILAMREEVLDELANLDRLLAGLAKSDPVCRLLMTAPGIGPITAIAYRSTIDDPKQFRSSRAVGAFLGLTPRRYSSGEIDRAGHITKCGDEMVRALLFEGASTILARLKKPCALRTWAGRIAKRSSRKKAVVAVARKLAVTLHRMWADGMPFQWHPVKPIAA